ncbi:DNA polymerase thumb domain-containing protein [Streptomyces sp. NPDC087843]|uniref:DNA polymerase Y family protein n=1 Tax=Streptomyces sp. NPDC087843 TaxID=3365804 RepID=UPI0038099628
MSDHGHRTVLHLRFVLPTDGDAGLLEGLRSLLENITPRVQIIEPDMAVLDLTGALPYWKRDARALTELIQLRALALLGLHSAAAVGPNRMLAAMACNLTPPDRRTIIDHSPDAVAAFLRPRPVRELPGVGSKMAATLTSYGLHRVGDVADLPPATLQRLLGARAGRTLHERALGHDTTIVDPTPTAASISTEHRFTHDELDPAQHRRALLALADDLGRRLRASGLIAAGLTCTIHYADHTGTRRSRTLPEATQHTVLLARTAYAVYESLGLQRARVRSLALRADALRPAEGATRQLTLDSGDEKPLAIEAVADRARTRYGSPVIYPAALATGAHDRQQTQKPAVRGQIVRRAAGAPAAGPHRPGYGSEQRSRSHR